MPAYRTPFSFPGTASTAEDSPSFPADRCPEQRAVHDSDLAGFQKVEEVAPGKRRLHLDLTASGDLDTEG